MENIKEEKVMEKIRKLLALSGNNPNENESIAAALKAQEMIAKYNVEIAQIGSVKKEEISIEEYHVKSSQKCAWRRLLANIVAKNFCCKSFYTGSSIVAFYGFKKDSIVARDVFKMLYENGNRLSNKLYMDYRNKGRCTKGIKNAYIRGYVDGIRNKLDEQCTALALVVPEKVENEFKEYSKEFKRRKVVLNYRHDEAAYEKGFYDGKEQIENRRLSMTAQ